MPVHILPFPELLDAWLTKHKHSKMTCKGSAQLIQEFQLFRAEVKKSLNTPSLASPGDIIRFHNTRSGLINVSTSSLLVSAASCSSQSPKQLPEFLYLEVSKFVLGSVYIFKQICLLQKSEPSANSCWSSDSLGTPGLLLFTWGTVWNSPSQKEDACFRSASSRKIAMPLSWTCGS